MSSEKEQYHHGNLAKTLVEVALVMIDEERGAGTLSLRAVAKRAQVSAAAVYRPFAHKEALLAAVAAEGYAQLNAAFARALGRECPLGDLHALGEAYIVFAMAHPGLYRLMFGANRPASESLEAQSRQAFDTLATTVAGCCGATTGADAVMAATIAAWSLVHGYAMLRLEGQLAGLPPEALPDAGAVLGNLIPKG